jgi:hypothetical protein
MLPEVMVHSRLHRAAFGHEPTLTGRTEIARRVGAVRTGEHELRPITGAVETREQERSQVADKIT